MSGPSRNRRFQRATADDVGDPDAYADILAATSDPATIQPMCEDYWAGLRVDRAADDADWAAGRRISCPTFVLWSGHDDMETLYGDVAAVWRRWRLASSRPITCRWREVSGLWWA